VHERVEEGDRTGEGFSWETARVVFGRLIGIDKDSYEITLEVAGEDGHFEVDYSLPEDFEDDLFEELLDCLDSAVKVVLLDNTVIRLARSERSPL